MKQYEVENLFISSTTDLLYITGISFSRGALLITSTRALLVVDQRYGVLATDLPSEFEVVVLPLNADMYSVLDRALDGLKGGIGFDSTTMTVDAFQELCDHVDPLPCCAAHELFSHLRRAKRTEEISAIEEACTLCAEGFQYLLGEIHEGVSELQLSRKLKAFWFEHGADAISFEPIIAFGPHSACPHWSSSATSLVQNSTILIDIGVKKHLYHSDMTRTIFFGSPDPEILRCHTIVQEAYSRAFSAAKPGIAPFELDGIARGYISSKGYGDFFVHGLGHGVGLEVHEAPRMSARAQNESALQAGDVITIEPGIYLPGRGGIRIENTVVVEPTGARSLFSLPIEPLFL